MQLPHWSILFGAFSKYPLKPIALHYFLIDVFSSLLITIHSFEPIWAREKTHWAIEILGSGGPKLEPDLLLALWAGPGTWSISYGSSLNQVLLYKFAVEKEGLSSRCEDDLFAIDGSWIRWPPSSPRLELRLNSGLTSSSSSLCSLSLLFFFLLLFLLLFL